MKCLLIYLGIVFWIWTSFPENYSVGERALVLVPLSFPVIFYIIYKTVGYSPQPRRETMSYEPGPIGERSGGSDCGGSDSGCDGGD
ncbi:MAG: hypothetical protein G3M70_08885 [Candidatus Nitronauta litoralis]|uniref:Uncharacterized protein n=1 Tax=Candidatus Nitronauta litoralis TaxID=2705533 RepID=A0A7T0BVX1_9BACT|nr:MAG: hypothetical protein G3M70_08885 [Candidatus Nitronauta litoralis]